MTLYVSIFASISSSFGLHFINFWLHFIIFHFKLVDKDRKLINNMTKNENKNIYASYKEKNIILTPKFYVKNSLRE